MLGNKGARRAIAVGVLGAVLSSCGTIEELTKSDFAKQEPEAIAQSAVKAIKDIETVRLTGPHQENGRELFLDMWVSRSGDCRGTLRESGNNVDVRRVDEKIWFKGDTGFFNMVGKSQVPRAALEKLSTHWVALDDAASRKAFSKFCDLDKLFKDVDTLTDVDGVTVGDEVDLDGRAAVEMSSTPGGAYTERIWVSSEAPHYILKASTDEARQRGTFAFSEFNEEVVVTKPASKEIYTP
ncbi:hypothetical protein EXE58_07335 [Nocardioides seonyuensis]|uniref:LppX_LprAFG lipoprotein n=1 Tax=Nocardioides seonyuensis TaxID=2518371 RepID=A0A4P7IDP5_9ACTN|nr:hypothetical protein [Nocardioides seonyuensis]QBX55286.1 hypothetical protein EXE58_07335 [Nocardioides seonyuensis]